MADNNVKIERYQGTPQTIKKMVDISDGDHGQKSFKLRERVEDIIYRIRPRDYWSECLAVYYWTCSPLFRYTRDPLRVEQIKDPLRILWELDKRGVACIDCDEFATFIRACLGTIGSKCRFLTVGFRPTKGKRSDSRLFDDPIFNLISSPHPRLPGPFTHVFAQATKPKGGFVTLDPVAGPRTQKMHNRIKQVRIYTPE